MAEFKVGLFDMTRTMASWLSGFPARIQQVEDELGHREKRAIQAARHQYEIVKDAKENCDPNNPASIKDCIFAAAALNDMLVLLERDMEDQRAQSGEGLNQFYRSYHEWECLGGICEYDL